MVNVAILYSGNIHASNGASSYVRQLKEMAPLFLEKGIYVEVFSGPENYSSAKAYRKSFTYMAKRAIKRILSQSRQGTQVLIRQAFYLPANYAVESLLTSDFKPDVLIFNDVFVQCCYFEHNKQSDARSICVLHNNGQIGKMLRDQYPKVNERAVSKLEDCVLQKSDCIVFVGEENRRRFLGNNPRYSGATASVRSGISGFEISRNKRNDVSSHFTFVSVGTVNKRKNQRGLIESFLRCSFDGTLKLIVVGDGEDLDYCKHIASGASSNRIIEFAGVSDNVAEYYAQADAYISASRDEGLPIAALEAMSCKLPLLLTNVGSCSELIDRNGVLIEAPEVESVKNAIETFLASMDSAQAMGEKSYEIFSNRYSAKCMLADYEKLIMGIIERHGRQSGD